MRRYCYTVNIAQSHDAISSIASRRLDQAHKIKWSMWRTIIKVNILKAVMHCWDLWNTISKILQLWRKKVAATSNISDDLIDEAIGNFVLYEAKAFTIIESKSFLMLLKILLKCKRGNVIIPKADAPWNGILKRAKEMKVELKKKLSKSNFSVHMSLDM